MAKDYGYPAYEKIVKASSGNEQAIKEILRFYDGYISKLCLRPFYHENGKISMRIRRSTNGAYESYVEISTQSEVAL